MNLDPKPTPKPTKKRIRSSDRTPKTIRPKAIPDTGMRLSTKRLPWETAKAYDAFVRYCRLGAERSLRAVAQQVGKHPELMGRWSIRWQWQERVRTWDDEQADIRREADVMAALEQSRKTMSRQTALKERLWAVQEKMAEKFMQMMAFPVSKQTLVNSADGTTTIIMPGPWRFSDAVRMAQAIQQLGAFSTGMTKKLTDPATGETIGDDDDLPRRPLADVPKMIIEIREATNQTDEPKRLTSAAQEEENGGTGYFARS